MSHSVMSKTWVIFWKVQVLLPTSTLHFLDNIIKYKPSLGVTLLL